MPKRYVKNEHTLYERALRYLDRFACTERRMREYLSKLIKQAVESETVTAQETAGWVDAAVARLTRAGLLNDAAYAKGRAGSLHRKGKSARAIRFDLRRKGIVDPELIDAAIDKRSENDAENPELEAAVALARRRRLGPYAPEEKRRDARQKHLASLARNGFSFDIARRVIDAETVEDLQELLD